MKLSQELHPVDVARAFAKTVQPSLLKLCLIVSAADVSDVCDTNAFPIAPESPMC
jgi:hypothetical protein